MEYGGDVGIGVATLTEHGGDVLQVGNGVEVAGRLFAAKAAIEVAAQGGVLAVPGQLANMVNVIDDIVEGDWVLGLTALPAGVEHPSVKGGSNHTAPFDNGFELAILKLARVGDKGAAVVVAGEDKAGVEIKGLPKGRIGEVGHVQ